MKKINKKKSFLMYVQLNYELHVLITPNKCNFPVCLPKTFKAADYRISTAAKDVVFTKPFHSWTMSLGKVFPIHRGGGVYQDCLDYCIDNLNKSKWVQYFPEGKFESLINLKHLQYFHECKFERKTTKQIKNF